MQFRDQDLPFLTGTEFTSGRTFDFVFDNLDRKHRSRIDWLVDICRDKTVVHIGCVDHTPEIIEHKRQRRKWLHAELATSARRCFGVDIQAEGIHFMRNKLGYADVAVGDALKDDISEIFAANWDFLVLGEVLEHTDNPVQFLEALRRRYAGRVRQIIITVPHAFTSNNMRAAKRGQETINSDHRYWFTPYTLAKVATRAGFVPREIRMCRQGIVKRRSVLKNSYLSRHPLLRSDIILIADF